MSKSYLVPTVITDVTGKTTTVYRRVDPAAPAGAVLPAPQVNGATTTAPTTSGTPAPPSRPLLHRMIPALGRQAEAKERAHLLYAIEKFAPDGEPFRNCDNSTLHKIKETFESLPPITQRRSIIDAVTRAASIIHRDVDGTSSTRLIDVIHAHLDVLPQVDYDARFIIGLHEAVNTRSGSLRVSNIDTHIKASKAFPSVRSHDARPYEENITYVRAVHMYPDKLDTLIKYAQIVGSNPKTMRVLRHNEIPENLIDLLAQFPDGEEKILDYMRERESGVPSVEDMTEMFDHHGSLNEGWL